MWALAAAAGLGVALGARHAFEPDHLAAVSTLVAERPRPRQAALLGALWGLGHTAALAVVGLALIAGRAELTPGAERGLEALVAAMLVVLGARAITQAVRDGRRGPPRPHHHGAHHHVHAGAVPHVHLGVRALALRPLVVGVVHGLAGSGGLAALAMAEMPTATTAGVYLFLFGLGSMLGMAAVSAIAAVSLGRLVPGALAGAWVRGGSGVVAVAVGVVWGAVALT